MLASTAAVGFVAIFLACLVQTWRRPARQNKCHSQHLDIRREVDQMRKTIDFSYASRPSLEERLALRAQPNQRLVSAFGVSNSLTTTSPELHRKFLSLASNIINARRPDAQEADTRWLHLYDTSTTLLTEILSTSSHVPLVPCVQRLTLTIVLLDNFNLPVSSLPAQTVLVIAKEINTQWLASKSSPSTPLSSVLRTALLSLPLPLSPSATLSLILPQYETLWRVVLLTFLTAFHLQPYPFIMTRTHAIPSCLGTQSTAETAALRIAEEGLRLYPSNKSIYRSSTLSLDDTTTLSADIQGLHRDKRIWGEDALEFRPERFEEGLTELQRKAYVPYSIGKHRCPAYAWFGNRMIVLLVVVLGRHMSREKGGVRFGEGVEKEAVLVLPTGREDMDGWVFEMDG